MIHIRDALHYRVVGIRRDGSRDSRYRNLSLVTAECVQYAMEKTRFYVRVEIEDQRYRKQAKTKPKPR